MKMLRAYSNYICAILVLVVLNVSIDIPDEVLYNHNKAGQEINEMESVVEFVFEACLDEENCFPETGGDDEGGDSNVKKPNGWKSVLLNTEPLWLHSITNKPLFALYTLYTGNDYSAVPYAPPCSA